MKKTDASMKGIVIALLIAMPVLTLLLTLAGGKLILSELLPEKAANWIPILIVGIVSLLLSLFVSLKMKQKKLMWGMGTAGAYLVLLMLCNLLFFGEGFCGIFPIAASIIGCGLVGSFLGAGKRRKYA